MTFRRVTGGRTPGLQNVRVVLQKGAYAVRALALGQQKAAALREGTASAAHDMVDRTTPTLLTRKQANKQTHINVISWRFRKKMTRFNC